MKTLRTLLPIALLAFACSKDGNQDTEAPMLTQVAINGSQDHRVSVATGDSLIMDISAADNEALKQVKIDIHSAFDGHGHGKMSGIDWTYVDIISMSGTDAQVQRNTVIPNDALGGMYHAVFRVLDASGNEGVYQEIELYVTSATQPQIDITAPDFATTPAFAEGDTLWIAGAITDDEELEEIHILLLEDDHNGSGGVVDELEFPLSGTGTSSWKPEDHFVYFVIPQGLELQHLELVIVAFDHDGNQAIWSGEINITP